MLANVHIVKAMVFPGVVCMWELDYTEGWVLKNWCFWIVVLEKTLESSLKCKEIKLVNPKWNQSWIFTGRTDDEAEIPRIWPPVVKNWLVRKNSDAGKDWRKEEKGMTEDEMVGWPHWFNGLEYEQTQGDSEEQGSLGCCSSWGCKEFDTTSNSRKKKSISASLTMPKPLTVWITTNWGKFLERWDYQTTWPTSWEIYMQVKKQKLEHDMEQQTGSKLGRVYFKAVYCHPPYLTYMQNTSCKKPCWVKHKLESRLLR